VLLFAKFLESRVLEFVELLESLVLVFAELLVLAFAGLEELVYT